ncbi:MAG TPA: hypothetical protein VFW98_05250 [Gemmatimonadaceae bacterium]|nr:hypothetical protein [Gemmatimonadaceae bacterium]
MRLQRLIPLLAGAVAFVPLAAQAQNTQLDSATLAGFRWRNIGPANMGGRVNTIAGIPSPSKTFYIGAAGGGIWKTTNAGTTFQPIFNHQDVVALGAIAIAPSDTNVVYVGTGDQNTRNTIETGGGVFKSTDGGKTWQFMGLKETQQIGRIVVDPRNADVVYVAALGHAWEPNKERGLYKSTDGGKTWHLSKFIDDKTGFVDVVMDPSNPNVLYASSYQRYRTPYSLYSGGPGSGLWKTTDAGKTWTEIKGGGFPSTDKGRIGIAVSKSNPNVVYALVEADSIRGGKAPYPVPASMADDKGAANHNRLQSGLYRSEDGGKTWKWMNDKDTRPFYYSQVAVDPENPNRVYWSSTPFQFSNDGGKTVRTTTGGAHVDDHAIWIDPNDGQHWIIGNDGGIYQTWDRGGNFRHLNNLTIGQFYDVSYDYAVPYRVCGGLQDNGAWCGPSASKDGPITPRDWFTVGGGDGFYTAQDPMDPNTIYAESQNFGIGRVDYATGERSRLNKPSWRDHYQQFEDSIIIARGDTTKPETKAMKQHIAALRAQQKQDSIDFDLRFNWETPYFISHHNHATLYVGANRVLKSTDRGEHWYPISPDLTTNDQKKIQISIKTTGGITNDATGAEVYGTVVALAESPIRPGLLYAGTDDGNVWMTTNDGGSWTNLTGRFPGVPPLTYVSRIEPSHFDSLTFYVSFDNHRTNDFTPYLYVTHNGGKSFASIANNLPTGGPNHVHVIREDPVDQNLLFVGTSVGAYVSRDAGAHWQRFMTGLPTVPVFDLQIQPRAHDLIAATFGRGIWITNIAPLEQMSSNVLAESAHLFKPMVAYEYGQRTGPDESTAQGMYEAQSKPYGAAIAYRLTSAVHSETTAAESSSGPDGNGNGGMRRGRRAAASQVKIVITNVSGDTVQTVNGPGTPGLHFVTWNFRGAAPPRAPLSPAGVRDSIIAARKTDAVFDSLAKAGTASQAQLDRLRKQMEGGGNLRAFFRGGRGGGGTPGQFQERPAESPAPNARGAQRRGGRGGAAAGLSQDVMGDIFQALRAAGAIQRGRGGFGRGGAGEVKPGDYLATITVDGKTLQQTVRVDRATGPGSFGYVEVTDQTRDR